MAENLVNRRILLAARPKGAPTAANFRLDRAPVPDPGPGQVLLRTLWLSLDPYMRGRMSDAPSYAAPVGVGEVMCGGTVSRIERSRNPAFSEGDLVVAYAGWQDYAVSDGTGLQPLGPGTRQPSLALGALGMPGFTAWYGLEAIGAPRPGETLVVAAASGAVGSVVGQVARLRGARVVGIAGGTEKCRYVRETLGFEACLDHRDPQLPAQLRAACPAGVDVYFENVGGAVFDAVLALMNVGGRIPVCGLIAHYNDAAPAPGPDRTALLLLAVLRRRLRVQGYIISDHYGPLFGRFQAEMRAWLAAGQVHYREHVVQGLESAPEAFIGMLRGANFGKLVVKVAD